MASADWRIVLVASLCHIWLLSYLGLASIGFTDACLRQSRPRDVELDKVDDGPCEDVDVRQMRCLNGGECYVTVTNSTHRTLACRCPSDWTGKRCELVHFQPMLVAAHNANMFKSTVVAIVSVGILVIVVCFFVVFVYVRYRRKSRLLADRLFKATAEELYRRPFNGRSSIVESLSRINSIRRTQGNANKETEQTTAGGEQAATLVPSSQNAEPHQMSADGRTDLDNNAVDTLQVPAAV